MNHSSLILPPFTCLTDVSPIDPVGLDLTTFSHSFALGMLLSISFCAFLMTVKSLEFPLSSSKTPTGIVRQMLWKLQEYVDNSYYLFSTIMSIDVPEFLIWANCVEYRPAAVVLFLLFSSFSLDVLVFAKVVDLGERSFSGFLTELVYRMKNNWITKTWAVNINFSKMNKSYLLFL